MKLVSYRHQGKPGVGIVTGDGGSSRAPPRRRRRTRSAIRPRIRMTRLNGIARQNAKSSGTCDVETDRLGVLSNPVIEDPTPR